MKYILGILLFFPFLNGCSDSASDHGEVEEPQYGTCAGFGSADINIFVRDSLTEEIIESALVKIYIENTEQTIIEAEFVAEDDNISNTETSAYYSLLEENSSKYEYGIVVSESNYHTYSSKNHEFTLNTFCGSNNSVTANVYLCELGTTCL